MRAYVILYRSEGFLSNVIKLFVGKYSHAAGFVNKTFVELDASDEFPGENDYHTKNYPGIAKFLQDNPQYNVTDAFAIPYNFTKEQCQKGIDFFKKHKMKNTKYGYSKLLRFAYLSKADWFLKLYYKIKKKPYKPIGDKDGYDVCSEAFAIALKKMGWWFTKIDKKYAYLCPETTHPMTFYKILKEHQYKG